ncbi:hypothetical protein [Flavobacterium sp. ACAM 123]|uniref:hypothetical protein n=1 Tax=Flavobacterium sp. ACAM 123 TaxID=1189620 RepID=UPI00031BFE72|nr:hypothetical protein [Flavobacterium sp. ACAM 123]
MATGPAVRLIPQISSSLVRKAKDPNNSSFEIIKIIAAKSRKADSSGIMDTISKYVSKFGLDQNADGEVDVIDAVEALKKNSGGLGDSLGSLFGKK